MSYENEQAGRGKLSRNSKKWGEGGMLPGANPKAPDYAGSVRLQVNGQEVLLYLSGWARKSDDGRAFISFVVEYPHNSSTRLAVAGSPAGDDALPTFPATTQLPPFATTSVSQVALPSFPATTQPPPVEEEVLPF